MLHPLNLNCLDEMRAEIAKRVIDAGSLCKCGLHYVQSDGESCGNSVPDYPTDLNACHELRKKLTTRAEIVNYLNNLRGILNRSKYRHISDYDLLNAEADEHCQAWLATMVTK